MAATVGNSEEAYADGTPLVDLLGNSARVKILSTVIGKRERELNVTEIADFAGVTRKSVYEHIDELVELGAVAELDARGGRRFTAADNEIAKKLWELDGVVLKRQLEEVES